MYLCLECGCSVCAAHVQKSLGFNQAVVPSAELLWRGFSRSKFPTKNKTRGVRDWDFFLLLWYTSVLVQCCFHQSFLVPIYTRFVSSGFSGLMKLYMLIKIPVVSAAGRNRGKERLNHNLKRIILLCSSRHMLIDWYARSLATAYFFFLLRKFRREEGRDLLTI